MITIKCCSRPGRRKSIADAVFDSSPGRSGPTGRAGTGHKLKESRDSR